MIEIRIGFDGATTRGNCVIVAADVEVAECQGKFRFGRSVAARERALEKPNGGFIVTRGLIHATQIEQQVWTFRLQGNGFGESRNCLGKFLAAGRGHSLQIPEFHLAGVLTDAFQVFERMDIVLRKELKLRQQESGLVRRRADLMQPG